MNGISPTLQVIIQPMPIMRINLLYGKQHPLLKLLHAKEKQVITIFHQAIPPAEQVIG